MPVPWMVLPPIPSAPLQTQIGQEMTVVAKVVNYDRVNEIYTFKEGVEARYGVSTVIADLLEVHSKAGEEVAYARGNVSLSDPDGTIHARNLTFRWKEGEKGGFAEDADVDFAGIRVRAASIDIQPNLWTLTDVYGTACPGDRPLVAMRTPRLVIEPGRYARAERPRLDVFGSPLITLPSHKVNLDPRSEGFRLPNLSYRRDEGFGIGWTSGWSVDPKTFLNASFASYHDSRPSYGLQVVRASVPSERATRSVAPRSDLANRLDNAYFDDVQQPRLRDEQEALREVRDTISIGSYWFQGSTLDVDGTDYTKPIELTYERGGELGMIGGYAQARLQTIRRNLDPIHSRLQLNAVAATRPISIARGLFAYARTDAASFLGSSSSGWVRGQIGVALKPVRQVTFAASIHRAIEAGVPLFPIDTLDSPQGASVRVDLDLGPTQLTHLWRYDEEKGWFDRQYLISQIAGCLEPYLLYREYQNDYRYGVNLRLGRLLDVLKRRDFDRNELKRTIIDEPGRAR